MLCMCTTILTEFQLGDAIFNKMCRPLKKVLEIMAIVIPTFDVNAEVEMSMHKSFDFCPSLRAVET